MNIEKVNDCLRDTQSKTKYLKGFLEKYQKCILVGDAITWSLTDHLANMINMAYGSKKEAERVSSITQNTPDYIKAVLNVGSSNAVAELLSQKASSDTLVIFLCAGETQKTIHIERALHICGEKFIPTVLFARHDNSVANFSFPSKLLDILIPSNLSDLELNLFFYGVVVEELLLTA